MGEKTMTVSALRQQLIEKATADREFRNQLMTDPKTAIKAETGLTVPSEFNIEVHQETATTSPPPSSGKPIWCRPPAVWAGHSSGEAHRHPPDVLPTGAALRMRTR